MIRGPPQIAQNFKRVNSVGIIKKQDLSLISIRLFLYFKQLQLFKEIIKMHSAGRSQKKWMEKVEKASKVLLVCVYDTVVLNITNEIVRAKFQHFGKITNILIFQKGEVTKLFVQFQQVNQAVKAKSKLDGTKLYETICKMTIYFSNFSNVEVNSQSELESNSEEYFLPKPGYETGFKKDENNTQSSMKSSENFHNYLDDEYIMQSFNPFNVGKRSKTQNPQMLKVEIGSMYTNMMGTNGYFQNQMGMYRMNNPTSNWYAGYEQQDDTNIRIKQELNIQSPVLWFPYRYPLKPKFIYNIFSNFGNVSCVIVKKQNVYIKFRTKEFAAMAITYLNQAVLMGNIMVLRQCPQESSSWRLTQGEYSQSIYYNSSYDRFAAQRSITINPPADKIHVSSIKKQICKQKNLRDIFSKYGDIERIKILQNSSEKSMALIKFASLEESINAIANLHNESFSGRKMQISFTKSKL